MGEEVCPSPLPSPGGGGGGDGSRGGFLGGEGAAGVEEDDVFGVDEVELFSGGFFGGELAAAGGGDGGAEVAVLAAAVRDLLVELADLGVRLLQLQGAAVVEKDETEDEGRAGERKKKRGDGPRVTGRRRGLSHGARKAERPAKVPAESTSWSRSARSKTPPA